MIIKLNSAQLQLQLPAGTELGNIIGHASHVGYVGHVGHVSHAGHVGHVGHEGCASQAWNEHYVSFVSKSKEANKAMLNRLLSHAIHTRSSMSYL